MHLGITCRILDSDCKKTILSNNAMRRTHRPILLILLVVSTCALTTCSRAPVEPDSTGPEGYNVYFHSGANPEIWYTYNLESDYLDSLTLPTPHGFRTVISHAGDRMFISNNIGDRELFVVNLKSRELIAEMFTNVHYLDVSPDGSLLAVGHEGFSLLNTSDLSINLHIDTALLFRATFSWDGSKLVGAYDDTYGWAPVTDPKAVVEEAINVGYGITNRGRVLTSPLSDHWYVYSRPHFFVDWDLQADTAAVVDTALNSGGPYSHYISRDGKYVVYRKIIYPTGHREIRVYDTQSHQIVDTVIPIFYNGTGDSTILNIRELVITPDSKWLVGINDNAPGYLLVYNLEELRIERFVKIPDYHGFYNLTCQTGE